MREPVCVKQNLRVRFDTDGACKVDSLGGYIPIGKHRRCKDQCEQCAIVDPLSKRNQEAAPPEPCAAAYKALVKSRKLLSQVADAVEGYHAPAIARDIYKHIEEVVDPAIAAIKPLSRQRPVRATTNNVHGSRTND